MIPAHLLGTIASALFAEHFPLRKHALSFAQQASSSPFVPHAVAHFLAKREPEGSSRIVFIVLIPVLVILSGIFAGLTLGYMSLDETQLQVLSSSGTQKQREYAQKIKPIRKNGHLLLVTLLLANMIVNESLPVIADPVLGGGVISVVVSTVLIVIFAEIIPQSICTRHGLYIGAKMAGVVRVLIFFMFIVAWPVAKLLEFVLGPHHGIIYRRAELKELIALHATESPHGGDLRSDTVTIIGATLDLQDKTVRQAMTPIENVFMLDINAKLDYETLRKVCLTGHSRIPVYEEVEVSMPENVAVAAMALDTSIVRVPGSSSGSGKRHFLQTHKDATEPAKLLVKKVIGILLVKQCVLLDPEDAVPIRRMRLNKVQFVPQNESLLGILDRFQEGRSHMAMVSRLSVESAASVKTAVKKGLTQRLMGAVRGDSSSSEEAGSDSEDEDTGKKHSKWSFSVKVDGSSDEDKDDDNGEGNSTGGLGRWARKRRDAHKKRKRTKDAANGEDLEMGKLEAEGKRDVPRIAKAPLEQSMPADAVLSKENAEEYMQIQGLDPAIMPLGIITLEDVLEELIGEEIYDEFDVEGTGLHSHSFVPPGAHPDQVNQSKGFPRKSSAPDLTTTHGEKGVTVTKEVADGPPVTSSKPFSLAMPKPINLPNLRNFSFLRSRSAPPIPRDTLTNKGDTPSIRDSSSSTPDNSDSPVMTAVGPPTSNLDRNMVPLGQIDEKEDTKENVDVNGYEAVPAAVVPSPALSGNRSNVVTPAASRSNTPPPLEAYLVERKRRAHVGGGSGGTMSPLLSPALSAGPVSERTGKTKGGFKSSPLSQSALESALDVSIADEIRKEKQLMKEAGGGGSTSEAKQEQDLGEK